MDTRDQNQINKSSSIVDKAKTEAENAAISKALKYNRSLIEANLGFMVTIGPNGLITDVNTATENAIGLPREKLIGTFFPEYFTEPGKAQVGYQLAFKEGKVINYELILKQINGTIIPVLYNASVYKDDEGQTIGVLAVGRDISAIKKYENELIDFKNNLEIIVQQQKAELIIANEELAFQTAEKADRAAELEIADKELAFQTDEKADRAAELEIADKELAFQTGEKADRAAELEIADKELAFQTGEKADRAAELLIANKELRFQNSEKADRAAELEIADKELAFQIREKADRAAELLIANKELRFQSSEKEKRAAELIIADKELESLSYSISHDLKAPLRRIKDYGVLLAKKYLDLLPVEGRRYLENISSATKNMGELIDGLLQFFKTGRIVMKQSVLNMNDIVNAYIQPIKEADVEHRIVFDIDSMPLAYGDLEMIKSVWSNLIENAVKYTRKNELAEITIGAEQTGNETIYRIKDNGAGFDMNEASKLFTLFQRLHSREDYEGTGIGLSMVQKVITRHGGRIWAESKVGEGATFYFTLRKRRQVA